MTANQMFRGNGLRLAIMECIDRLHEINPSCNALRILCSRLQQLSFRAAPAPTEEEKAKLTIAIE
jgi:hypothetical protein